MPGVVLLAATYLLLVDDNRSSLSRSLRELWNLGHVFYFFLLVYLISQTQAISRIPPRSLSIALILFTLTLGGLLELGQLFSARQADIEDLFRDLTGTVLGLVFLRRYSVTIIGHYLILARALVLAALAIQCIPFLKAITDEVIAYSQFPILASNDTPLELDRWQGNAKISTEQLGAASVLKVTLSAGQTYPGISLHYFPRDWRGYDWLNIRLFNPASKTLRLTVRIHDRLHEQSYAYEDRYNSTVRLGQGWSVLKIELKQVVNAPKGRKTNLRKINDLSLFGSSLQEDMIFYVDRVYLSR